MVAKPPPAAESARGHDLPGRDPVIRDDAAGPAALRLGATRARLREALLADGADIRAGDGFLASVAPEPDCAAGPDQGCTAGTDPAPRPSTAALSAGLAGDAVLAVLEPLASRHPVALVAAAAATGAAVALLRPWRWQLSDNGIHGRSADARRHGYAGSPSRGSGVSGVAALLAAVPIGTWIAVLQWTLQRAARTRLAEPDDDLRR